MFDVARVVGWLGIVEQRGRRLVDPEGTWFFLAREIDGADDVFGLGRVGCDFVLQVQTGGHCCGQPGKQGNFEIPPGEKQGAD